MTQEDITAIQGLLSLSNKELVIIRLRVTNTLEVLGAHIYWNIGADLDIYGDDSLLEEFTKELQDDGVLNKPGDYMIGVFVHYNEAQIGDYPPPNVEADAYFEILDYCIASYEPPIESDLPF